MASPDCCLIETKVAGGATELKFQATIDHGTMHLVDRKKGFRCSPPDEPTERVERKKGVRDEAKGSRVIGLLAGLFFGATAIVMVLSMQVSDWRYPAFYTVGYPLCALAFLMYAIRGRER
jgi:hypothetical protein